ncbi:hypothetical protein HK103_005043 [Boothiomyces macroporosus]|uniref:Peptidase A1 domain-containing protein n=1 Tax=Boothiomyces macroporosus TaxID=261099 RepID=A0AAD5UIN8_9FUNG|nr:hypothetical protein HK103_005043 [Boothiomyces macroporosus]
MISTALIALVSSERVAISLPTEPYDIIGNGIGKQLSSISGGFTTCFLASLTANSQTFIVQVDTGSSDTVLPATGLNNYIGSTIAYNPNTMGTSSVTDTYGDGSYWSGYQTQYTVTVTGTNISAAVPIALMTSQSTNVVFADGSYSNGLLGLGFPILSAITIGSRTVVDGYLSQNVISKNQVGIYGCPYSQIQNAWMDIGNTAPYSSCSNIVATINMPYKSYYNINIQGIQIGGVAVSLPSTFQSSTTYNYGGYYWSFMDTCNSAINLPSTVVNSLISAIKSSGGLPISITYSAYYNAWLTGQVRMAVSLSSFQWALLPNISIIVNTGDSTQSAATFVLGPQQYIQADENGYVGIMITAGYDQYAVLGLPFFSAYYVLVDRNSGQLQVSLGCSCLYSTSNYPKIITSNGVGTPSKNSSSATKTKSYTTQTASVASANSTLMSNSNSSGIFTANWTNSSNGIHSSVVFRLVSSDRISITIPDSNVEAVSAGIAKQISTMGGGYKTCYLASLTAQSKTFNVQVDTGSSDTVLPASILNNYTGPSLTYSSSMGTTSLADHYADTSYWSGYQVSMVIGVTGTSLSTTANVALMTQQSTNPIFADGSNSNGLVGLGFPILAAIQSSPQTIMDAFYASGQISQKQVAIHGCPYSQVSQAYIDIGNTSPYQSCSNVSATITMPYKSYYTVDVRAVYVGGNLVSLPSSFQSFTTNQYGGRYWSFMDSCNSDISLPQSVLYALQTAVQNSGGLPLQITTSGYLTQWLNSEVRISVSSNSFIWSALPTLAFNVSTGGLNPTIVQFVLGPQQYIQADSSGYCKLLLTLDGFIVSSSPDYYVVLGLPFFSAFHVVADLNAGQLAVSIGCACSYSTDGNPKIVTSNTSAGAPITNVQSAGASSYKDTGSSDTALPGHAINNFSGPTIPLNITDTSEKIFNVYADGSSWTGGAILLDIALDNIDNYTSAPVGLITSQSTNPTFIDGHSYTTTG